MHLENWPSFAKATAGEARVVEEMEEVRKIVEMGLSLRKEAGVRVRQPLSKFSIFNFKFSNDQLKKIIAEELNVKEVLSKKMSGDNWVVKEEGKLKVALNVELTEDLKKEGLMREVVRAINQMRKENKLSREHRVVVEYSTNDEMLNSVFVDFNDEIKKQVLADEVKSGKGDVEVEIDSVLVKIKIKKAK